ncbi:flagellar FlbD family protein [Paenibacillus sp. IB182496]|uniref:Flagellar FlbD family protein n=1 Tax=Paenibacillus sabuli TaxID=2772509 RepID=A0A927GRH6_9BACL|nr:flagellar FlbD family protein [Paenibacillus sabuli]MBD2845281.1 flagellar FlbD family protein [Paenibacillus sabuli]
MITVTRLNGTKVMLNALLVETVEEVPDTLITLTTGKKYLALESSAEIAERIQSYLRTIGIVSAATRTEQTEGT